VLRTFAVGIFMVLLIFVGGPPLILYSIAKGSIDLMYRVAMEGFRFAFRLAGVRIRAEGFEHIPEGVCVFVANHTSNLDPPAVGVVIPRRIAVLAKGELFRIPIVGTALRLADIVPVDRSNRDAAIASVEEAVRRLRSGISFLVFPEGTRSRDGRLRPFKKGTFVMAIEAGVPIVPISIAGSNERLGKGMWRIRPGEIRVRIGEAVDAREYAVDERSALLERVQNMVADGLAANQRPQDDALDPNQRSN
jgi:1-acyl-sn-glycerol-3-phosphate acyltransferase